MANTVRLHRVLRASPDCVFRAFVDPDAMAKWLPPSGYVGKVHEIDARVGGRFRMSFTHFASGRTDFFGGEFLEMQPNTRLRYTDVFEDPGLAGEIVVTVDLKKVPQGTELNITQTNLPEQIPVESCYIGWQQSLLQLGLLVEDGSQ